MEKIIIGIICALAGSGMGSVVGRLGDKYDLPIYLQIILLIISVGILILIWYGIVYPHVSYIYE
jgi:hypothetical protein